MYVIKYGCILTSANKAGTDLDVEVFSDSVGGTTTVTVAEGDVIGELIVGTPTSVAFWVVHDGTAWEQTYPGTVSSGELMMTWGGSITYQQGATFAVGPDGSLITPNLGVIDDLIQRALNP